MQHASLNKPANSKYARPLHRSQPSLHLLPHAHELEPVNSPGPSVGHKLAHVMSSRVLSATPATEIREIVHVMLDEQISAIMILDSSRHPVGILTTSDILRAIVHRSPLDLRT